MKLREVGLVGDRIQYHPNLAPEVWENGQMVAEVRERLVDIAQLFVDYLDLPDFEVDDVVLTGSLANFNYTPYSDFDLHVVTDYSKLQCDDVAEALYNAKKTIWNDRHDITIHGYDVELYIEDTAQPPVSSGMFSILENQWIKKPEMVDPRYDKTAVNRKAQNMIDVIQKTIRDAETPDQYKMAIDKVYRMRQAGLDRAGEFSTENLAFKVLRNMGYIDRLRKGYDRFIDDQMTL